MKRLIPFLLALLANPAWGATAILDTFTDSAGTELVAHTPDTDEVGGGWAAVDGCATNACEINGAGTALSLSGGFLQTVIDSGQTATTISVEWTTVQRSVQIVFRSDGTNCIGGPGDCWRVLFDTAAANEIALEREDAGSATTVASASLDTLSNGDVLKVIDTGTAISVEVNDVEQISPQSSTTYASNTYVGLATGAGNDPDIVDDFTVTYTDPDTITYDADNYALGATIGWSKTGFASGDVTSLTEQAGGDSLTASGGSATACALADLVDSGNCDNTQLGTSLTWRASNGTETADDTFTLDFPTGSEYSTTSSIDCTAGTDCPGDSVLVSPATTGDDAIFHFTSGSGTCNASGVCSTTTSTADVDVYVYDNSAGAWLAKRTVEVTEASGGDLGECKKATSSVIESVIRQMKDLVKCAQ